MSRCRWATTTGKVGTAGWGVSRKDEHVRHGSESRTRWPTSWSSSCTGTGKREQRARLRSRGRRLAEGQGARPGRSDSFGRTLAAKDTITGKLRWPWRRAAAWGRAGQVQQGARWSRGRASSMDGYRGTRRAGAGGRALASCSRQRGGRWLGINWCTKEKTHWGSVFWALLLHRLASAAARRWKEAKNMWRNIPRSRLMERIEQASKSWLVE
jgi:hypothetical protein